MDRAIEVMTTKSKDKKKRKKSMRDLTTIFG